MASPESHWPRHWLERPPGEELRQPAAEPGLPAGCGEWLILLVALGLLAAFLIPALADARKRSKVTDCKGNLKQLGVYLVTYVSRYGSDTHYPSCGDPGGVGSAVSLGANGAFWGHLWRLPVVAGGVEGAVNPRAVCKRPGENGLFACKVYGWSGGATNSVLHYSGPDLSVGGAYPGGKLTDRVRPSTYIAGDLLLPGDCNHGEDRDGQPSYDFNGLRFDGSVHNITPNGGISGEHKSYLGSTNAEDGVRTP